jgi:hypothetical protein
MPLGWLLPILLWVQPAAADSHERFFVGRTEGHGMVRVVMSGRRGVTVRSRGRMDRGALIIDQVVEEQGRPPRSRSWRLLRSGSRGVTGTISDARGPVTGHWAGNVLYLRYRMADGPSVEQWITFHANGRTAANRMTFRRFGLVVAHVEETIRRVD